MDPTTAINVLVIVAVVVLLLVVVLCVGPAISLMGQAARTLIAFEKLANTLDDEVPATLVEVKHVAERINQISNVTSQSVTEVGHKVEEMGGSIGQIAQEATKHASIWRSGLLAGIKTYLTSKESPGSQVAQLPTGRGEQYGR